MTYKKNYAQQDKKFWGCLGSISTKILEKSILKLETNKIIA
jgi:hypothetical protein